MKMIIKLIVLSCFCFNIYAQDIINGYITPYNFSKGLSYQSYQVNEKGFITNSLELFKTYEIGINTFEINTKTNEFASILFANGNIINITQNSEFRIDLMNLVLKNTNSYPSKINIESCNLNISLMDGELYVVAVNQIFLQTPLSNIGLETGYYFIQSTKKSIMIFVLDGEINVYDNVTNKKEQILSGNAVLIRPAPLLSPKQLELFNDKMTTTIKKAKLEQFKPYLEITKKLELIKLDVIFVQLHDKIIAVKIK